MPAALVLFGDVIRSRRDSPSATAWLRTLTTDLTGAYTTDERLARFEFTQGDELQGLLAPSADPIRAVLRAALHPRRLEMRWVIVRGDVDPGRGPATQRSGPAFVTARERLEAAAARRERFAVVTGHGPTDAILDGITPLLGDLLAELTPRQREIGWLLLVEGLRRADVAERLRVSRATISVAADRAHLRWLGDALDIVRTLLARPV
ncbi:MAG TPA: sigma-70 region 4 domain-containing protein, partial [Candidatus Limnocylindrales bacterium]|nr:sigma-70 region 4 domain-containing protein [Candidatus Limnocylindrales bacterium]